MIFNIIGTKDYIRGTTLIMTKVISSIRPISPIPCNDGPSDLPTRKFIQQICLGVYITYLVIVGSHPSQLSLNNQWYLSLHHSI